MFGLPVPAGIRVKPEDAGLVWEKDKVVVAKVLEITKHPDADKLKLVKLDYGAGEPKTVVTGATNIAPGQSGMKVVLGLKGTRYFYTDKDGKKTVFTLEPKALRGIMNDAMCMSNFELGISDEHEGIIILDDSDPVPGTPVADMLGEIVVELDILPNMARCLSMIGIAREVAALTGAAPTIPEPKAETVADKIDGKVAVVIEDPKLCPRYTATIIRNVDGRPGPAVDAVAAAIRRDAADQQRRGHHQLRDARTRPAAARLRLRRSREAGRRQRADDLHSPREDRREAEDARRPGSRTLAREPRHRGHRGRRSRWRASWAASKPRSATRRRRSCSNRRRSIS